MKSSFAIKVPNGHGSLYKEVRFSPTATPVRRSQSVPNTHFALATDYIQPLEGSGDFTSNQMIAYLEQSRSLLDRQRKSFNHERAQFAEERRLWEKERELLKLRISELETLLKKKGDTATGTLESTGFSELLYHHPTSNTNPQVWEGSSPGSRPTRVFPEREKSDSHPRQSLVSLEQGGAQILAAPSLDAALSPKSRPADSTASIPVPIEKLDSKLDGITLKSSALPPEIVARVMTPPSPTSPEASPSSSSGKTPEQRNNLRLRLSDLAAPETNLVRHAGHTPMAIIDGDVETAQGSPHPEAPLEGADDDLLALNSEPHPKQPAESSSSYFSGVIDLSDDPALKGPLSLLNEKEHDDGFLQELDQKLLDQAMQALGYNAGPKDLDETAIEPPVHGEQEPEIKFKNSTNFGTAFGYSA